ncbi:SRPBCC family protein [Saccharopolyspora phatthalungensis]|uniref:Putative membrane protein n=1 Tax=Saccharopolyspora phatthalungensis TaxID=664693 RepID=A0A840Q329_9PSEU|nr:SRPBCC family protein [Saccharopolyspora phatthalungensis]MBB5156922.1 putative membrane protein [Saccharopolyspora phatthalungensis]
MGSAAHYLEINAPAQRCYDWWRPLTHVPEIFPDVERVEPITGQAGDTHWVVTGPAGKKVEWDARIVEDEPGRKVAWKSMEEGTAKSTTVANAGVVRFDDHGDTTGVEVSLQYDAPGGTAGEVAATLFADPQKKIERALDSFKNLMESAQTGR